MSHYLPEIFHEKGERYQCRSARTLPVGPELRRWVSRTYLQGCQLISTNFRVNAAKRAATPFCKAMRSEGTACDQLKVTRQKRAAIPAHSHAALLTSLSLLDTSRHEKLDSRLRLEKSSEACERADSHPHGHGECEKRRPDNLGDNKEPLWELRYASAKLAMIVILACISTLLHPTGSCW